MKLRQDEVDKIWISPGFVRIFIGFIRAWNPFFLKWNSRRNLVHCAWSTIRMPGKMGTWIWISKWAWYFHGRVLCHRKCLCHSHAPIPCPVDHPQEKDKQARYPRYCKNRESLQLCVWYPGDHWRDCTDLIFLYDSVRFVGIIANQSSDSSDQLF